jgi:GNAT superfamily N-acetyltransferase
LGLRQFRTCARIHRMNETSTQPAIVRHAVEADMAAIMELLRLKAEFDGYPDALEATPQLLREAWFSDPPRAFVLVAEIDGLVVGLATYYSTFSTFLARPGLWLDDLFVREGYRSRGVGLALMARLARIAEQNGCGRIEWTVGLKNERGIAFYERHQASVRHGARYVRLNRDGVEELAKKDRQNGARQNDKEAS